MDILDVAFVIAVTAFLKEQLGLSGKGALLGAFLISLAVGFAPLLALAFPLASPYIEAVVKVVTLFLGAAGTWDVARSFFPKPQV